MDEPHQELWFKIGNSQDTVADDLISRGSSHRSSYAPDQRLRLHSILQKSLCQKQR